MVSFDKAALRAAMAIHARVAQAQGDQDAVELPVRAWRELERLGRCVRRAGDRGWYAARRRLLDRVLGQTERLQWCLQHMFAEVRRQAVDRPPSTVSDLYRDIAALEQDFPETTIDPDLRELAVTTEPITLERVPLGRFSIRLDYAAPGLSYRVVALEPNPAAGREDVTHPHIQDESLCEGEGRAAIQAALAQGRLWDFFVIVSQILSTYGRGRAYVELAHWDGAVCHDCGQTVSVDQHYACQRCGETLCEDCSGSCCGCDRTCCCGCLSECSDCQQAQCRSCLEDCSGCGKPICPSCRQEELCEECHANQNQPGTCGADDEDHHLSSVGSSTEPGHTSIPPMESYV